VAKGKPRAVRKQLKRNGRDVEPYCEFREIRENRDFTILRQGESTLAHSGASHSCECCKSGNLNGLEAHDRCRSTSV